MEARVPTIISTHGLRKEFRGFVALHGVDLRIAEGDVHALVGPNGAGKTTLFNLLCGFLVPSAGRLEIDGRDVTGLPPHRVARLGVARSFQITSIFPALSVREHVELALQVGTGLGWRFWRSDRQLRRFRDRALGLLDEVGLATVSESAAGALAVRPQARPGTGAGARARTPGAAARRADRRYGCGRH